MNRANLNSKRQLLADLLGGSVDALRKYKANQLRLNSLYRWIVKDEVTGITFGIGKNGSQHPISMEDFAAAPQNHIWRIVDFSGGGRIPEADEEY